MIPYDELVRALSDWRARNGLPVEEAHGLFDAGADLGALAQPITQMPMTDAPAGDAGDGEEIFVSDDAAFQSVDETAITSEETADEQPAEGDLGIEVEAAGDDAFGDGAFGDDAFDGAPTAIGEVPEHAGPAYVHVAVTEVVMPQQAADIDLEGAAEDVDIGEDEDFDEEAAWAAALARANQAEAAGDLTDDRAGTEVGDSLIVDEEPDPDRS